MLFPLLNTSTVVPMLQQSTTVSAHPSAGQVNCHGGCGAGSVVGLSTQPTPSGSAGVHPVTPSSSAAIVYHLPSGITSEPSPWFKVLIESLLEGEDIIPFSESAYTSWFEPTVIVKIPKRIVYTK